MPTLLLQGLLPEQVPTAEGLTIRVINNVTKKCDVSGGDVCTTLPLTRVMFCCRPV